MNNSKVLDRIKITNNEDFTIPETASLYCSGGGIFKKGISIGSNQSIIPGSIRFINDKLEYRKSDKWVNISFETKEETLEENKEVKLKDKINSLLKFGLDGEIKETPIYIENSNITGIELIETDYISSKNDLSIASNNIDINLNRNGKLSIFNNDNIINFITSPPQLSKSPGNKGDFAWDDNYIYICIDTNKWKRSILDDW